MKQWERKREFECSLYAGLQATLHNAHFDKPNGKPFTAAMFMPGYKPPVQTWQEQKEMAMRRIRRAAAPEIQKRVTDAGADFLKRQKRAKEAQERGATRAEIKAIMEG